MVDVVERLHDPSRELPIQVPNGRHLRIQHMYGLMTPSPPRSSEGGEVVARVLQQHDGVVAAVVVKSQQSFAKHYGEEEGCEGEERQRRGMEMCSRGCGCHLSTSLYIGGREEEEEAP